MKLSQGCDCFVIAIGFGFGCGTDLIGGKTCVGLSIWQPELLSLLLFVAVVAALVVGGHKASAI